MTNNTRKVDGDQFSAKEHRVIRGRQLTPDEVATRYGSTLGDWQPKEADRFIEVVSQSLRLEVENGS
jgi:hypothetical protein